MKKRLSIFIFLILVLSLSIISAEWWNPFEWGAPSTPEEICKKYSRGPYISYECFISGPTAFVPNCLIDFPSPLDTRYCNGYTPPAGYKRTAYYPLNCLKASDKYNVFCEVASALDWDCDGDKYTVRGTAVSQGNYCPLGKDCNDFDPTKTTDCGIPSSGGTPSGGGLLASTGSIENYQQQMQQNIPLFSPITQTSTKNKILILLAIIFIIIVIGLHLKRKKKRNKKSSKKNIFYRRQK